MGGISKNQQNSILAISKLGKCYTAILQNIDNFDKMHFMYNT